MKAILKILFTTCLFCIIYANVQSQSHLRWYPKKVNPSHQIKLNNENPEIQNKDSTVYFGPSISFDLFIKEKMSGQYKIGAIPGVGYGVKWNPLKWKKNYLVGLDLFVQANLSEEISSHSGFDYFNVDLIPVLTILNWIGIGYGPRFKIGLDGVPNANTGLLSIGIRKSL